MLGEAVIVADDGSGADVGVRPDPRVADIGEMVDLGALLDLGLLDLDEVADPGLGGDVRAGPAAARTGRPTAPPATRAPSRCEKARITAPSSILTPGPITTWGSMSTSRPILVSYARNTVSGAIKRRALGHRAPAQPVLQRRLGFGELRPVVDAHHLLLVGAAPGATSPRALAISTMSVR